MSIFIQFLLDNMPLVVITGLVVLGIVGLASALIVCAVRDKKRRADATAVTESSPEDKTK